MMRLLSIELLKLYKLRSLRILFLIYLVALPGGVYGINYVIDTYLIKGPIGMFLPKDMNVLRFPDIWGVTTYVSSYFNVLMGILMMIVISHEYTYRTMRQQVIDGLSIRQVILSKFIDVLIFSILLTGYTLLIGLIYGFINTGFEVSFTNGIHKIVLYFVQTLSYLSLAFLIVTILKKTAISIIIYILSFLTETLIGVIVSFEGFQYIYAYMPLNVFSKLIPFPILKEMIKSAEQNSERVPILLSTPLNLSLCVIYMSAFFVIAFVVLKKRDL